MKRNIKLYLGDIDSAIKKILRYTKNMSFEKFVKDSKTIDAVLRNFSVLGEAIKNIPSDIKSKHPEVPWRDIIGMRNKIIHEYFGVDEKILWKTIKDDVPSLRRNVRALKNL